MPLSMTFFGKALVDLPSGSRLERWRQVFIDYLQSALGGFEQDEAISETGWCLSPFLPSEKGKSYKFRSTGPTSKEVLVNKEERFRLCLSCLEDHYLSHFIQKASSSAFYPIPVESEGVSVLIDGGQISSSLDGKWNRWMPYEQLAAEASDSLRRFTLKFVSATSFDRDRR